MEDENCGNVYLHLHPTLRQILTSTLGWKELRPVQEMAYFPIRAGKNTLIMAGTAGGKSEAAIIPVLDYLIHKAPPLPVCLYVAPVKALINDIAARFNLLLSVIHLQAAVWHGDRHECWHTMDGDPAAVLLTTPESLHVLMNGPTGSLLSTIRFCIIDEVHILASSSRGAQLMSCLEEIEVQNGIRIIRIGLSATVGNPEEVLTWFSGKSEEKTVIYGDRSLKQKEFRFLMGEGEEISRQITALSRGKRVLLFAPSKSRAEELASSLKDAVPRLSVHHAALSGFVRSEAEDAFNDGLPAVIICTSTLELGIDIGDLDFILQYGPPSSVSSFLQRLGRVGRRKDPARMGFLLRSSEELAMTVAAITAASAGKVEPLSIPRFPYDLLIRETLLLILSERRIGEANLMKRLLQPERYRYVSHYDFCEILSHLICTRYLTYDGDLITAGPELDRISSMKRSSLFSLISDNGSSEVLSEEGDPIGRVHRRYRPGDSFLLGGSAWVSTQATDKNTAIYARQICSSARPPVWQGSGSVSSLLLLSTLAEMIEGVTSLIPLPEHIRLSLGEYLSGFPPEIRKNNFVIQKSDDGVVLFTFLGLVWNRVLGRYLADVLSLRVRSIDEIRVLLTGRDLNSVQISGALDLLKNQSYEALIPYAGIISRDIPLGYLIPEGCLNKFWYLDRLHLEELIEEIRKREIVLA